MARVKKRTNSIAPFTATTLGCLCFSFYFGIEFFLAWPLLFVIGKIAMGKDIDNLTKEDTEKIIEEARKKGEKKVTITQTIPSGGALVNLPMTRKWTVKFDDEELR